MSKQKAVEYVNRGLYGDYVKLAREQLEQVEGKNPITWFIVERILYIIEDRWDTEPFTPSRTDKLNALCEPVARIIEHIDEKDVIKVERDLVYVIENLDNALERQAV